MAGTVMAGLLGYLINEAFQLLQKRWLHWSVANGNGS